VRGHEGDAGPRHGLVADGRLLQRQAERLLAQDVLAGRGRRQDGVLVQVVRQADIDRVHPAGRQQLAVVAVLARAAQARRQVGGVGGVDIGHGRHPCPPGRREPAAGVGLGDAAAPDDADRELVGHGRCPPSPPRRRPAPAGRSHAAVLAACSIAPIPARQQ
jgi:hypothetical protein